MIPEGLKRCGQCGELRGEFLYQGAHDLKPAMTPVICLCEGIVCRYCRKGAIRRPISNRYDEATETVWHSPYFGSDVPCWYCRQKGRPDG